MRVDGTERGVQRERHVKGRQRLGPVPVAAVVRAQAARVLRAARLQPAGALQVRLRARRVAHTLQQPAPAVK